MAVNQYVYADQLFRRTVIAETELHLKGTYADAGTYVPRDAVDFEGAKYVALIGVSGTAPYGNHSDFWSSLSLITPQPIPTPGGGGIPDTSNSVQCHHINWGTDADEVNAAQMPFLGGGSQYPTVESALAALFYVPPQITAFNNSIGTVEIGSLVTSVALNWSFNKAIVGQTLSTQTGPVTLPSDQRSFIESGSFTTDYTYGLLATDGQNTVNGNTSISFSNKRYWGASSTPSPLSNAQIIALNSEFASSRGQSKTILASAQYVYFAYPSAWGLSTFTVNGLPNTDWVLAVVSFTNASGYTSSYNLYQSGNLLTGNYNIVVS